MNNQPELQDNQSESQNKRSAYKVVSYYAGIILSVILLVIVMAPVVITQENEITQLYKVTRDPNNAGLLIFRYIMYLIAIWGVPYALYRQWLTPITSYMAGFVLLFELCLVQGFLAWMITGITGAGR